MDYQEEHDALLQIRDAIKRLEVASKNGLSNNPHHVSYIVKLCLEMHRYSKLWGTVLEQRIARCKRKGAT